MKFSVSLEELQYVLKCVRICVKSNTTDPAGRISIFSDESGITFVTSNNLNSIKVKLQDTIAEGYGRTALLYKDIQPFVQSFQPYTEDKGGVKSVDFKLNDKSISVSLENTLSSGSKSKHRVRLGIFEALDDNGLFNTDHTDFVLSSSMLKASLDKVNFIIDPAHNVTFLRGVSLKFTDNDIFFAGTNGIVISEQKVKNTSNLSDQSYIFSYEFVKGLRNIVAFLSSEEMSVHFCIDSGKVKTTIDNIVLVGNLIIGYEFPDYRSELIKNKKHSITVDKELLMMNLNSVVALLDAEDNYRITLDYSGDTLKFNSDGSESICTIEGDSCDSVKVDVNGRLLKQIVTSIQDDKLLIKFTDENTPILLDSEMFKDQKALITHIKRRST